MSDDTAAERFAVLAQAPDERVNLAEAVLWIAKEEYPDLDVAHTLGQLDELAAAASAGVPADLPAHQRITRLNQFLFVEQGFRGDDENYSDPRNSFLNDVLERRIGIPISLALVYTEVGRRLGLAVVGVGFPGHFLVKHDGVPEILIDPFFGRVIDEEECARRLKAIQGEDARLDRRFLAPARPREVLTRWLRNLKQSYLALRDWPRALRSVDRMLVLAPEDPRELRDRGILFHQLECYGAALRDFRRYLELAPEDDAAGEIRARLPDLVRRAAEVH